MITLYDIDVESPRTLEEALQRINQTRRRVIAGGTDVVIQMKEGVLAERKLLNIYQLDELRYIRQDGESLRIGALTSLTDIAESREVRRFAPPLAQAAGTIGSIQVTNKGTIGGNLGNASPSGDCIPPLYALEGRVVVASLTGRREVPVRDFFRGYKQLNLRQNELITEINFKKMGDEEDGLFLKHTLRLGEACSVVSVCMWLRRGGRRAEFVDARIALGAVAPTVVRADRSEEILKHGILDERRIEDASQAVTGSISPITDVRGSAEYRREMAVNLTYRGLHEILARSIDRK
ncbi:MAG: xanthine dehydrogenase family protein subunit M [Nitrososphaerales archaeon]|nr:xanthine dehydrogenase family protein subunit M [Nitrososphaerales archaeon]